MLINKKIMASAICLFTVLSLIVMSGCDLSEIGKIPGLSGGEDAKLYLDGKLTEISTPERESSAYRSYNEIQKLIYSAAYTALITADSYTEFKLSGVDYEKVFSEYGDVLTTFMNDYPEFFWLDGYVEVNAEYIEGSNIGSVTVSLGIYEHWKTADLAAARGEFAAALKKLVNEASALEDDYSKVKLVHDYIIKAAEYDYDSYNAGEDIDAESNAVVHTAYGPLVDGRAMCGGYARAFKLIMNKLGIEAEYITGDADGGPHAWNSIKLGEEYYYIDLTWDDTDGEPCEIIYYYFCLTAEDLKKTHSIDAEYSDIIADSDTYNYYVNEGLYLEEYDFDTLNSMWTEISDGMLTVRFETTAEMDEAYEDLIRSGNISKLDAMTSSSYQYMISNDFNILTILCD